MNWLNYHHLLYFWTVASEGSVSRAAERLHLAQPTLSNQIKKLEATMGVVLFERKGRSLVLTDTGQTVYQYADKIFSLGRELSEAINDKSLTDDQVRLSVGVPDALPKLVVYRLLQPALKLTDTVRLVCHEGKLPDLLADLAQHRLDIVLADTPISPHTNIRAFNHSLGQCGVTVFGTAKLAAKYKRKFPMSLIGAPMLLPTTNTTLRRAMQQWFDANEIRPQVVHEFEDSAVLKVFGQEGEGLFVAPSAIETEICRQYDVQVVGHIPEVTESFYAISVERRLKHPAVVAISTAARKTLFGDR